MAKVLNVCISKVKGTVKEPVDKIHLIPGHGIEGDAHAGNWHRQVSILAKESVNKMQSKIDTELKPGVFAENILSEGIEVMSLPIGQKLRIGGAVLEVTQIGKECHADCAIRQQVGDCVMPREGVFMKVLEEGEVCPGDGIELI